MNRMQFLKRVRGTRLTKCESGSSAVEFALIAPVLFFSLLASVDIGLAVNERMIVDQALRAGAEQAMADPGATTVKSVAEYAAMQSFSVGGSGGSLGEISIAVNDYCACPGTSVSVSCSGTCSGGGNPYRFYDLSATKTYSSMIIPEMTFNSNMTVQVR